MRTGVKREKDPKGGGPTINVVVVGSPSSDFSTSSVETYKRVEGCRLSSRSGY